MKKILFALMLFMRFLGVAHADTTYTYTGPTYDSNQLMNYGTCAGTADCANYTSAMKVTGSFTVASPLISGLTLQDISAQLVSWTFNDGLATVSSSGTGPFIRYFQVSTDSSGNITDVWIGVDNWQTTVATGNYFNDIFIFPNVYGGFTRGAHALKCDSGLSGNFCSNSSAGSYSQAQSAGPGTWVILPTPTVASINPTSGLRVGGTTITITGTNMTGATAITVGGSACTNVTVVSATSATCTTPAGTAGTASVLVTTPGGTNAANSLFTYVVPVAAPIPTLSEWAMIFLASLMAMFAIHRTRRQ